MSRECKGTFLARERRDNKGSSPRCTHEGFCACTSEGLHAFAHVALLVIRMCTRARLAGVIRNSFLFNLLLTSQPTPPLLHKERRHRSRWLTPDDSCVSNDSEEEAQQGERRVIIPEPPGLELPGLPDFLPVRGVETEARVVQRGETANAGSRLRPRYKEMKDMRLFEDIVSEDVSDKLSDRALVFFSWNARSKRGKGTHCAVGRFM